LKLRYPNGPAHAPPGDVDVAAFKVAGEQLDAAAMLFAGGQVH
jgi:hypothetical protein